MRIYRTTQKKKICIFTIAIVAVLLIFFSFKDGIHQEKLPESHTTHQIQRQYIFMGNIMEGKNIWTKNLNSGNFTMNKTECVIYL